jgi:glycosyltransferase involved in cell wall biosynthesis
MNILQVMAGASVGGAEGFYLDALRAIHETGHSQYALTRNKNQERLAAIEALGITVETASFDKNLYCSTQQKLKRLLKEYHPDIVHHWLGRAASFAVNGEHINLGWYGAYYHPKYYKNCDHHVAVTKDVADHIISHGVGVDRVHVLHIYTECQEVAPVSRAEFDTPEGVPVLLSLARLHPVKGLDMLLEALMDIPDAYLWLAGTGPLEQDLKQKTSDLGLQERVRFLGWRTDREALLAAADICVFPSRNDSFGAVILEAWATRTPLVATKAPGPRAYVHHEETGLLVDIDDRAGFADAVNRVLKDKDLQKHLTHNGRKAYEQGFTKEVFKENVTALYEHVLR